MSNLLKTGPMSDIAAFQPGYWNGTAYSDAYIKKLVDNFNRYCTGKTPFYKPYLSLNHNDLLAFGEVSAARIKPGQVLSLDAENVPMDVQGWIKSGALRQPSIEIMEPKRDNTGKIVNGFRDASGKIVDGPMIKCLTFLGADLPGVKGLPALSTAKFRHFGGIVRRFSAMDRASMIQFLTDAGVDVSMVTDACPDEFLAAVIAFIQKANQNPPAEPPATAQMSQAAGGTTTAVAPAGGAGTTAPAAAPAPGTLSVPSGASQVVLKFNEQFPGLFGALMAPVNSALAGIQRANATDAATRQARDKREKERLVKEFCDRMLTAGRMTIHQRPGIERRLMKCDHLSVLKFNQNGKTIESTEFDFECADVESTHPVVKTFGHKTTQPAVTGGTTGSSPDRKARLLAGANQSVGGHSVGS